MKCVLTSFASTESKYIKYADDIKNAAKKYFNGIAWYTENNIDNNFKEKNRLLFLSTRGYGYWVWKPYIIYNTLKQLNEGDICMYVDAGLSIINNPQPLIDLCKNTSIVLFENSYKKEKLKTYPNYIWTKRDCFVFMGCDDVRYTHGQHIDASCQIYMKNSFNIAFLEKYLMWCQNMHVVSDLPNISKNNYDGFIDHRHDQSVLSLLAINHGINLQPQASQFGNESRPVGCPYGQIFNHHRGSL